MTPNELNILKQIDSIMFDLDNLSSQDKLIQIQKAGQLLNKLGYAINPQDTDQVIVTYNKNLQKRIARATK